MNCRRFPTGLTLKSRSIHVCHRFDGFGRHRTGLWGTDTAPLNAVANLQLLPRQPRAAPVSLTEWQLIPLRDVDWQTRVADGDKTNGLLFAAGVRALPALQRCHSARQNDDAIESRPFIITMQYAVGHLSRIYPSSWFVYLFVDMFETTAILKVQGDIWGAHFNMSIPITLPWQPWKRSSLCAVCHSSLLSG